MLVVTVAGSIDSEKVAVGETPVPIPVAPFAGVVLETVGAAESTK